MASLQTEKGTGSKEERFPCEESLAKNSISNAGTLPAYQGTFVAEDFKLDGLQWLLIWLEMCAWIRDFVIGNRPSEFQSNVCRAATNKAVSQPPFSYCWHLATFEWYSWQVHWGSSLNWVGNQTLWTVHYCAFRVVMNWNFLWHNFVLDKNETRMAWQKVVLARVDGCSDAPGTQLLCWTLSIWWHDWACAQHLEDVTMQSLWADLWRSWERLLVGSSSLTWTFDCYREALKWIL